MRESVIERKLLQEVRQSGGLALKLNSPGARRGARPAAAFPGRQGGLLRGEGSRAETEAPGQGHSEAWRGSVVLI